MTCVKNLSTRFNSTGLKTTYRNFTIKENIHLSEYSFRHICREVVIFGAEYNKWPHRYGLETLLSELVFYPSLLWFLNYSLLKSNVSRNSKILLSELVFYPSLLWFLSYSLLKSNVSRNSKISKFSLPPPLPP